MDVSRLRELLANVKDDSKVTNDMLDTIVEYYSKDLDEMVHRINVFIRKLRSGEVDEYTDEDLELDIIEISGQMYSASRELAKLGGESDMARQKRISKFNDIISRVNGTVAEKKAKAEQMVLEEQILEDIYSRAYEQLKRKLDKADSVYSALKKVYSKRMLELDVFRKEIRETRTNREDVMDEE